MRPGAVRRLERSVCHPHIVLTWRVGSLRDMPWSTTNIVHYVLVFYYCLFTKTFYLMFEHKLSELVVNPLERPANHRGEALY
jgi:hypothetical protein